MEQKTDSNDGATLVGTEEVVQPSTEEQRSLKPQPSTVLATRLKGRPRKILSEADQKRALKQRLDYLEQFGVEALAMLAESNNKTLASLLIDQSYAAQKTAARLLNSADGEADPKQMDVGYKHAANFMKLSIEAALAADKIKRGRRQKVQKVIVQRIDVNQNGKVFQKLS